MVARSVQSYIRIFGLLVSLVMLGGCATPAPVPLRPGTETTPPEGCIEYRMRDGQCLKDLLQKTLDAAKNQHEYHTDLEKHGVIEYWDVSLTGDCEDFALWCRDALQQEGIRPDLVYCETEQGKKHLVLHVDGWIIDSRYRWVMRQDDLPYKWLKIGTPDGRWFTVDQATGAE